MSSSAAVLVAHGPRDPGWAHTFESIRDRLRGAGTPVELAFLEFMSPSLDESAAGFTDKGIKTVIIVPLFLAQGAHLKRELPAMVAKIRKRYSKTEFRVTPALGAAPATGAAITEWVQHAAG